MRSYQMQVDLLLEVLNIVSGFGPTSGSALTSHMDVDKGRLLNLYLLLIQQGIRQDSSPKTLDIVNLLHNNTEPFCLHVAERKLTWLRTTSKS
ncbi:uncharacterized protein LOC123894377 isoform X2 [Trifolium pratense]|uniref:uncharacterized protein LOC123882924 n=1 Tax=Trifolium pratense TaxID=57577 RepID=UPI001E6964F4|nr:uncharacterized protein LOC123882924 [Trifolium pratense]XP_045787534.1 uncharacterized protein LOC123882924 [Trifolium pratense]XP_045800320.1 uncharacterized protein LOC123894377 isoform X2 [Trifolium pratense]